MTKNRRIKNPVAKNCNKFNKAVVHVDRKKESKKTNVYKGDKNNGYSS